MKTTLKAIRAHSPCSDGWTTLLRYLEKAHADDEPLHIRTVLDSNGLDDALWCFQAVTGHDREIRLYAVWCARHVQHLMADQRSIDALNVAERHANGQATDEELDAASAAARAAAKYADRDAAWAAQAAEFRRVLDCIDSDQDPYPQGHGITGETAVKTLTGRTRYRSVKVGFFGPTVLALQVEEHTTGGPPDKNGLPEYLAGVYWRDATASDLSLTIEAAHGITGEKA